MSDQTESTEQKTQTDDAPAVSAADVRKHPLFEKLTGELAQAKAAYESFQAQIAADKEKAEKKALEEQGNWTALRERLEAEHKAALAAKETELRNERLTNALLGKGVKHEFAHLAARQQYTGEQDLAEFVAAFVASDQVQALLTPPEKGTIPAPPGYSPASRSKADNWQQVLADKTSGDPAKMKAAALAVRQFMLDNEGKRPPGF